MAAPARAQDDSETPAPATEPKALPPERAPENVASGEAELHLDEYDFDQDELCPFCEITPEWPEGKRGLHWHDHWRAVGWPEYVATPLLWGTSFAIPLVTTAPTEARWSSPILFDGFVRDNLVAKTQDGQDRSALASDILFYSSVAYPMIVDDLLVTWIGRQSPRVAWQLFVINAQSYGLSAVLNGTAKTVAARERPWGTECPDAAGHDCSAETRYRSFYSGHATMTATGAGLMCAHHTQLALYKNPVMDTVACLTAVGFTTATGVLRMTSDNHWATDVVTGHFMGYVTGYLFPTLMYYREFRFSPTEHHHQHDLPEPTTGPIWAMLPIVQPGAVGVGAAGVF